MKPDGSTILGTAIKNGTIYWGPPGPPGPTGAPGPAGGVITSGRIIDPSVTHPASREANTIAKEKLDEILGHLDSIESRLDERSDPSEARLRDQLAVQSEEIDRLLARETKAMRDLKVILAEYGMHSETADALHRIIDTLAGVDKA